MRTAQRVLVSAAAAILSYQLMLPPVVALADNGDFVKILGRFDLYRQAPRTYDYAGTLYQFRPDLHWDSGFHSTEVLLVRCALSLNSLFSKDGLFDVRLIGAVHAVLFLWAMWLAAPLLHGMRRIPAWLLGIAMLLIFCDVTCAAGLNFFYMDEPAFLFLLLSAVLFFRLQRRRSVEEGALLIACSIALAASKTQHAPLGFLLAGLFFLNRRILFPRYSRPFLAALACLPLVSGWILWKGAPPDYSSYSAYNAVFSQILPQSRNPEAALRALGLDDSVRPLIGKNAYVPGSRMDDPAFLHDFQRKVSFRKLAVFYATHPRDTYRSLRHSLDDAVWQGGLGTFDPSAGYPPLARSRAFSWWSALEYRLFFHRGSLLLFTFSAAGIAMLLLLFVRRRALPAGSLSGGSFLFAMAVLELATASLGDAMDVARHHTIFFALFHLMLLVALAAAGAAKTRIAAPDSPPESCFALPHPAPTPAAG